MSQVQPTRRTLSAAVVGLSGRHRSSLHFRALTSHWSRDERDHTAPLALDLSGRADLTLLHMNLLRTALVAAALVLSHPVSAAEQAFQPEEGFTLLFDGKSLAGWKVVEKPESFTVQDGAIVAKGNRAHAFYTGDFKGAKFKNFELRLDVMTKSNSNGGVYIGTVLQESGWPSKGYEIQVNNTHSDWRKTGGLYGLVDNKEPFEDDKWMSYVIRVEAGKITSSVNGKVLVNAFTPEQGKNKLAPDGGTIALQAHDPESTIFYKNIRIKPLE